MIFIVDRFVEGYLHVLANVNTIKILNIIFPGKPKTFIAEKSHLILVQEHFNSDKQVDLIFDPYKSFSANRSKLVQLLRILVRTWKDILFFKKLFRLVSKEPHSFIFITHVYPLSLIFVKFLKKLYPEVKVILTMHGEVEYLYYGKTNYEKLIGKIYDLVFQISAINFYYLFLTKVSKRILVESKKLNDFEILTIILPTLANFKIQTKTNIKKSGKVKIGHIGSAGRRKNVELLYEIANVFKIEIEANKVDFVVIGPIEENLKPYLNNLVTNFVGDKINVHLERDIFNIETEKIDYSIFFYGEFDFVLRSSAAFFDAIHFEKPIIAFKNPFFTDVFKEAGEIGYLCDNLEEMKNVLNAIIENDVVVQDNYQKFLINISKYKKTIELGTIAKNLNDELRNLDFDLYK
ncbi:glycosyltransferase family protein [Pedobacter nototheniae]|uniref:hypothetical protein n=1 Tax=Pedobacter nototheniae TaxID=2488994 RepID=UPI00103EAC95|nr:hypothetical protein [Pedobacter nototheniae]